MARKKIACVMTEYRVPAHADVIIGKFLNGVREIERMLLLKSIECWRAKMHYCWFAPLCRVPNR